VDGGGGVTSFPRRPLRRHGALGGITGFRVGGLFFTTKYAEGGAEFTEVWGGWRGGAP
jgi:hypothetical protein